MDILTFNVTTSHRTAHFGSKLVDKTKYSCKSKVSTIIKPQVFCARIDQSCGLLRFSSSNKFLDYPKKIEVSKKHNALKGIKVVNSKVLSGNYNGYVIEADEDMESVSGSGESTPEILIPGLPNESSGECGAPINSCFWEWKPKLYVHYEKAGCENVKSPPVLFLPGFGVGSFHFENQLKDLGRDYRVWAIDFLGQGMSLPVENPTLQLREGDILEGKNSFWGFGDETEPWANELVYSMDLWRDQVRYFIEEVIGEPVYVVGNSLGGFVAIYFAASNPQLVKGVTLLNATPFWGFLPNPIRSPRLARIIPWSGTFPLPASLAENKRSKKHSAAAASFASIMFAPQGQLSFRECLMRCKMNNLPICLLYGREDPWVKPIWGLQVKRQVPEASYYEISPAGHCPHDEVPEVVNYLIRGWLKHIESSGSIALPLLDDPERSIFRDLEFTRGGSQKSVKIRLLGSSFSFWNQIFSYIESQM
ncbi:pheophytinase, chloroplastic isoform X4 [Ricinus communis]|uniref:pheophytinase, chloroplastic isoform X4 n=1 Tax=Ricinus communis TaxID=3988 RepID=UPI00077287C8|nr:pheophytinase, chloroplastic isoform X4 [Ricinus communis]|eukprot:XP_015571402.1 pheophytinase, chloroplastic isoform X3 [Ricinus communis]